jgi:RNA polymerase II subunit A-like phosphatase
MHVYTMGTRAYAEEVCKAIDPDGKLFCGRVLSRDESGSQCVVLDIPLSLVDI